ncbi:hypothetical protein [Acinetobacter sp. Tr-809]|uniref:hypothetical protein n=1 Tax=Acinetobacter sp. Tr-809 TaxID=2608324 RepID=UPI00141DC59C|nr:hypothetical protein [Acinetobacter sp. Tr-809]NIE96623.1 hypothetical protein [Acinetobacter sp. Tr-809]
MKQIAAFLIVLVGLGVVVFYFEPSEAPASTDDTAVYHMSTQHSETITSETKPVEVKRLEHTNSNTLDASQQDVQFYDTKSDPSIQPIDPDTDPANEIKKL